MQSTPKPVIAISIGDLNGISPEIALRAHDTIKTFCQPLYFTNYDMIEQAAGLLGLSIPNDFKVEFVSGNFRIKPGKVSKKSGDYSFRSFAKAVEFTKNGITKALVTLPIHKEAWAKAGIPFAGHTDALRHFFQTEAIMMLGCENLFVALYTEHIPLKEVVKRVKTKPLKKFLLRFYNAQKPKKALVLGLNPHAGDGGVLGDEERFIAKAIKKANEAIGSEVFIGPAVADTAFTPKSLEHYNTIVAMYHDQGLAPLKALYFDTSINVSLGLPIIRTSPDHGTAFDIAYTTIPKSLTSYINAVRYAATAALTSS